MPTRIIQKDGEKPVDKEVLAQAITKISQSVQKLYASGLNKNAVIALVKDNTGLTKRDIEIVLNSLSELQSTYCR